jgi:hypothetical protein
MVIIWWESLYEMLTAIMGHEHLRLSSWFHFNFWQFKHDSHTAWPLTIRRSESLHKGMSAILLDNSKQCRMAWLSSLQDVCKSSFEAVEFLHISCLQTIQMHFKCPCFAMWTHGKSLHVNHQVKLYCISLWIFPCKNWLAVNFPCKSIIEIICKLDHM